MKALSIKQPWAYLICSGIKDVENRSWRTNYRGKVLIHACAKWDNRSKSLNQLFTLDQWKIGIKDYFTKNALVLQSSKYFPISAIIGSVEIFNCTKNNYSVWADPKCWNWWLKNPVLFDQPIFNVNGALSFWEYKGEVLK